MIKQVPAQEGQLGPGGLLVSVHEWRVVPAGQADQLAAGCSLRRVGGGPGERGLVLVADEDEQRSPDAGRVAAGPVEPEAQRQAGGDRVLPLRIPVARVERPVAIAAVRRGERSEER